MEATGPIPTPAADVVRALLDQVDRERALSDLRKLSGEEPVCVADGCHTIQNRETGSQGLQWAKDYVYQELVALGYSVDIQDWSRGEYADQNLVVRKEGTVSPGEEIYFLAHLDGYKPDGVERSPAADDDATGVVALLELARVLSSHSVANTVVLLISTGEEHGALGARSYIDQLSPDELAVIKYAVSVEMLGYDSNGDGAMQLWPGDHAPSEALAEELSGVIKTYELKLDPAIITGCD